MDVLPIDFSPQLHWPAWWPGNAVLFVGLLAVAFSLHRRRHTWKDLTAAARRGFWLLLLMAVVVNITPALSLTVEHPLIPTGPDGPTEITLLSYAPVVLAAGWWGGGSAVVLALVGGLANALWHGQHLFALLEWALVAGLVSYLVRQDYIGGLPALLRRPLPAVLVVGMLVWPLQLASLILDAGPRGLSQLDLTTTIWSGSAPPLFGALLITGLVGEVARGIAPNHWYRKTPRRLPPYAANLNRRLLFALLPMALVGIAALFWANTLIARSAATRLVVHQMERDAEHAAEIIPFFIRTGESLALDLSREPRLRSGDARARAQHLSQEIRTVPYFSQLVFFDALGRPLAGYPETDVTVLGLTPAEIAAVQVGLQGVPGHELVFPERDSAAALVSFVSPVTDPDTGASGGALLGRAEIVSSPLMLPAINSLQGLLVGSGMGFITDGQDRILYHPDAARLRQVWRPASDAQALPTTSVSGHAYQDQASDGSGRLVYYLPVEGHPWNVVIVVPVSAVLTQATRISFPLALLLLAGGVLGIVFLLMISRHLTRPLGALATATEQITAGKLDEPVRISGADEVGRLGEAFERMRVRVRSQVDGLSLLLQASISVASSLNLEESLPPILQGALSVTDAEGARLLLMPFDGRQDKLQSYSAGAGAAEMSAFDANILQLVEAEAEIVAIENVARARTVLDVGAGPHSLQAVIALPLQHEANLLGTLWLGYTEPHHFSREESDLLTTLAGQAAVAVANARLFEASEGGRQQLAAILTATPDAVIVTDSRLRLLLLNPAAEDLFELQEQQITGRRINEMIHQPQLAVALRASDERASAHEIKLPDGRTFSASTSSILRQDGSIFGRLAVLRDVTDFKQLDRQKTDAIAAVSHDLKNPLSLMHGYASMLPMVGQLNARQRDFSEKIVAGVEQMSTLIEDVLDLHRIESAPGSDWERCRLEVLLQQVVEEMRPAAVAKGIQLACAAATGIEPVSGDENLLRRAIRHLLDNGVRYTSAGGSVQARVEMRAEGVVIAVADSGVGISRADQGRLFERFYRVKGQQEGESGGSGLGLAFVKSIAERHGGRVWLESQLGQGSTFFLSLPTQKGDGDES